MSSLDTAIGLFFNHFYDPIKKQANYLLHLRSNVEKLDKTKEELADRRKDVEHEIQLAEETQQQKIKHEVQGWVKDVKDIEDNAAMVLKDYQETSKCFAGCPVNCWSGYRIGRRAFKAHAEVVEQKTKGAFADAVGQKALPDSVVQKPTTSTVGADLMLGNIMRYLREDDLGIIGIYGMGGVGKTTLLKKVNNEFLKDTLAKEFDYVIFEVVSKDRSIDELQRGILEKLGQGDKSSTQVRADAIFKCLNKKRFLLLLDDIWKPLDLEALGVPVPKRGANKRHKVMLTTRLEGVCSRMDAHKRMKVECLTWEEAWNLFSEKVGEETINSEPSIRSLAEQMVNKCGGLPLALIVIGRAMSTKRTVQEWQHALTTLRKLQPDIEGVEEDLFSLLKYSYDSLPNDTIRECFLTFALFPENYAIEKDDLISHWMGLGLFDEFDDSIETNNKAHNIIGILMEACLLDVIDYDEVVMHDVSSELAMWIANECGRKKKCIIYAGIELKELPKWGEVERLSLMRSHLPASIELGFFGFMPTLQYLDLSHTDIRNLSRDIDMLVELQYLNLSYTHIEMLPVKMGSLVKLKLLDLDYTTSLRTIPGGLISKLSSLCMLRMYNSHFQNWVVKVSNIPDNIDKPVALKEFEQLKMLKNVSLSVDKFDVFEWLVQSQIPLQKLYLQYHDSDLRLPSTKPWSTKIMSRLEVLQIFCRGAINVTFGFGDWCLFALKSLTIRYGDFTSIVWQVHPSRGFPNLRKVEICDCGKLKTTSWLLQLPQLEELNINYCTKLECLVDEKSYQEVEPGMNQAFHRLKSLKLYELDNLRSICSDAVTFPCLVSLDLTKCLKLRRLPAGILSVHRQIKRMVANEGILENLDWKEEEESIKSYLLFTRQKHMLSLKVPKS